MKTLFAIIALLFITTACTELAVGPEPANTPEANFEQLWKDFDRMYGLFERKGIDWDAVYRKYRPQVKADMSDEAFYTVVTNMLGELNDGHVWLLTPGPNYRRYDSGPHYDGRDFDPQVTRTYLSDWQEIRAEGSAVITYGTLPGKVGYVHIANFGQAPAFYGDALDKALTALGDTKGLVVDVRGNEGGDDRSAQEVAGRFAAGRKLYMTARFRNGARHTDFSKPVEWYSGPTGKSQYTKPLVLLTNRLTQSAGETFTLAMKQNPRVRHLGDLTYGIFSENPRRELPNGWLYTISVGDYRAADGQSFEGVGITPDERVRNLPDELKAGRDKTLEKALESLK